MSKAIVLDCSMEALELPPCPAAQGAGEEVLVSSRESSLPEEAQGCLSPDSVPESCYFSRFSLFFAMKCVKLSGESYFLFLPNS